MSVFRIEKNTNYTVMSNYHLRDKNLSYKAKGLLSFMLSLPDDWDYSINGLVAVSKESIKAIRNFLEELKENDYLVINQVRKPNGQYEYEYHIFEKPDTQKGDVEKRNMENDLQINTNKQNTNNKDKYDKQESSLIKALIDRKFINKDNFDIPKYQRLLEEILNEYDYYDVARVCNYIVEKWEENKGLDENGNFITNKFSYFKISLINNLEKINNIIKLDY